MQLEKLKSIVNESGNIVFFGGAGVSTESSIPDFRSAAGIFNKNDNPYPPEVMLSHSFFMQHTEAFYKFYKDKMIYKDAKPNKAHNALAELEKLGKLKAVVTQNIDGLHQMAGSKEVIELHGSVYRNYCMKCRKFFGVEYILDSRDAIPICDECGGIVKPDVVLYEEQLNTDVIKRAVEFISNTEVLIVGGTSLVVFPAAGLLDYYRGNKLVLISKSSTPYDGKADLIIIDSIGKTLESLV